MKPLDISHCFETAPEALDFVLPGMLAGSVGSIISPGGGGKSMMVLQVGAQIASGADTLKWGKELKRGKVVYMAAEDPIAALHHRLHQLGQLLNPTERKAVVENLTIYPLVGEEVDLLGPATEHGIIPVAQGCRLLIYDTLRRFHGANENDSGAMSKVVSQLEIIARETGSSALFLHHSSKSAALNGMVEEQQSSRGSSVLTDNIRWQGFLSGLSKGEAKDFKIEPERRSFYVRFGVNKQNYGQPCEDVWLERGKGGLLSAAKFEKVEKCASSRRVAKDGN